MFLHRALFAGMLLGLTVACSNASNDSTTQGITQEDIDKLLKNKKPGACLAQNLKEPIGKTQDGRTFLRAFCKQKLPEGASLSDCQADKKRLGADWKVTYYATKHCDDLKLSGKDLGGAKTVSSFGEASDVAGVVIGDEAANQAPAQPAQPEAPANGPKYLPYPIEQLPKQQQDDGGVVVE